MPEWGRGRWGGVVGLFQLAAATLGAVAVAVSIPTGASAQAPDEPWRTLATEHFRVTFRNASKGWLDEPPTGQNGHTTRSPRRSSTRPRG